MAQRDLSQLFRAVLPAGFEEASRQLPMIQQFLEENLPEAVRKSVTVLSVNETQIVLGASTPMVANYLRLHSAEIQQQFSEALRLQQALKFRTIPDALMQNRTEKAMPPPRQAGAGSILAIRRNADWIEDDALRAALLALADSLEADSD